MADVPPARQRFDLVVTAERHVRADRVRRDVEHLAAYPRNPLVSPERMREAAQHVDRQLTEAGWHVRPQEFTLRRQIALSDGPGPGPGPLRRRFAVYRRLHGRNLLAQLPGTAGAATGPTIVLGAHLDSVRGSPGADDNASGVAVALEVARLLPTLPVPPRVTIAIFDLEELGMIGSRQFVKACPRGAVGGMLCLESVGFFSTEPHSQRLPPGAGTVFPAAARAVRAREFRGDFLLLACRRSSEAVAKEWQSAAGACSLAPDAIVVRDPRPDGRIGALLGALVPPAGHLARSDHAPFWNRRVPAMMLTDTANFRNPHYHRESDTPDLLDYDRLAGVAVATAVALARWPGGSRR